MGARWRRGFGPTAFGNALGESIKDQMIAGGGSSPNSDGEVYQDGGIARSELRFSSEPPPSLPEPPQIAENDNWDNELPTEAVDRGPLYAANDIPEPTIPQTATDAGPGGYLQSPRTQPYSEENRFLEFNDLPNSGTTWEDITEESPAELARELSRLSKSGPIGERNTAVASIRDIFIDNLASATPEQVNYGRQLLRQYGFPAGATEGQLSSDMTVDQRAAALRGEGDDALPFTVRSAQRMIGATDSELADRFLIFSSRTGGAISRVVDGEIKTIDFKFDPTSTRLASGVGVSFEEARAKTQWNVYGKAIDAAFATDGVRSLEFNGLWRPTVSFYRDYFANSQDHEFDGMTGSQRTNFMRSVMSAAGITPNSSGQFVWSNQHTYGTAVDINRLNGRSINNGVTSPGGFWHTQESTLMGDFTDALAEQGPRSLLTPWRIYRSNGSYRDNPNTSGDPYNHRNHIHFGT